MNKLFRGKYALPVLRDHVSKNIPGIEMPIKERDLAQKDGFKPGDKAPYAYHNVYEYPEDYRPWTINYNRNNWLYGMTFAGFVALYMYEEDVNHKKQGGYKSDRPSYPC